MQDKQPASSKPKENKEQSSPAETELPTETDVEETSKESAESSTLRYTIFLSDEEAEQLYSFLSDNFGYDFNKQEFPNLDDVICKLAILLGK